MTARPITRVSILVLTLLCYTGAFAQAPPQLPKRTTARAKSVGQARAPHVVTIVHRLNALKMFRLLLRSEEQVQAIAGLDSTFNLMDDVHTNVIAGLTMDDGETIAAWLPDAEVEFGPPNAGLLPRLGNNGFERPDITVIGSDGKQLEARYIGLDAVTGLSILRLAQKNAAPASMIKEEPLNTGETVLLFGPEPVTKARAVLGGNLYVRMGATEGRIQNVITAPSGDVARLKVTAAKLSRANIGGVAVNEAGETIGIVDGLEGGEASILPAALIRRAAERVLEQESSVPRPWLGVQGEAVAELKLQQLMGHGWEMKRALALAGKHRGIMLTSIAPNSPAARALLRAGDVILKVDDKEILNADDFTWWLEQAGPSSSVQFTVARPDRPVEEPLDVKLSGRLDPALSFYFGRRISAARGLSLVEHGIETIALKPAVASQLGTTAGLLVVFVQPSSAASEAGLKVGDVIQSIDGRAVWQFNRPISLPATQAPAFKFEVVRKKEKLVLTIANPASRKK